MKALIYARLSPRNGDAEADLARMVDELQAFAADRNIPVSDVIAERDISAWTPNREGRWYEVIEGLESRKWDALIVRSLDRCARDMVETIKLAQLKLRVGFEFYAMNGDTLGDELIAAIDGWKNARASRDASDRLRLKWADKAAKGDYHPGRYRPFGYQFKRDNGHISGLVIDPNEAEVVRDVTERIIAGESLHSIALELDERQIATVGGGLWDRTTVRRMIKPTLAGLREFKGELLPGNWDAIITVDQYNAAIEALKPTRPLRRGHNTRKYLLSGLAVCGRCSVPLRGWVKFYQCSTQRSQQGIRGCGRIGRTRPGLDQLITELVLSALEQEEFELRESINDDWKPYLDAAQAEIDEIQRAYEQGEINSSDWIAGLKIARAKYGQAETERTQALARATGQHIKDMTGSQARERWEALNLSQKRAILFELIEAIVVKPAGKTSGVFNPDLIEVIWRETG